MRRLLSVLMAAFMLLTMPLTTGISRAIAEGTNEPTETETPSEGVVLETEDLDPATLHVHKLGEVEEEDPDEFDPEDLEPIDLNKIVRASIFLDEKSTIDVGYSTQGIANNSSATAYRNKLKRQQETMQATIESTIGHELNVKWNLTLLVNAFSVEIPYKDIALIRRIPGVKSVELENIYAAPEPVDGDQPMTENTSSGMVGAQAAWADGYTGAGSIVAILDTGVDTTHQSFNGDAFDHAITETGKTIDLLDQTDIAGMQLNATGTYVSAKIPFAYNYADHNSNYGNDVGYQSNHGSHVAGIAAANRFIKNGSSYDDALTTVHAVGMAPDAQILAMKVFGSSGGAAESDYFVAIEDAIVLGADSINLSLGSAQPGFTYAGTYQAKLNEIASDSSIHLVLAIAASNSDAFDDHTTTPLYQEDIYFQTTGSPATYLASLATGAAYNTGVTGAPLVFNGNNIFYTETSSTGAAMSSIGSANGTSYNFVYIDGVGSTAEYTAVNSAVSLSNKIVIVNRGELSFYEKGNNAVSYSPKAVIVANNEAGTINMSLDDYTGSFPMVSITLADAQMIKAGSTSHTTGGYTYYTGSISVKSGLVSEVLTAREDAEMVGFSSWGVTGSMVMKPEIVAPGGNIYSVNGYDNKETTVHNTYATMSGTSMAAPHIAGLSAIVAEYLRENNLSDTNATLYNTELANDYSIRAIMQSLLMSTATPMKNNSKYVSILQQGAGLAEVSKAVEAKSVIMMDDAYLTTDTGATADGKVKVELGDDPARTGAYEYSFNVYNLSGETLEYTLDTKLFTQAIDGDYLSHETVDLPTGGVTYDWVSDFTPEGHDVDMDGDTDDQDAQAILDYLTGEKTAAQVDLTVADLDEDGAITSHDAHVLLNWQAEAAPAGYVISAHGKATVTVHINLTAAQKAVFDARDCGGYIEGFTYVTCTTADVEGVSYAHQHTIPIIGYYGSWTDPEMFDTNSYTENLYGNTQTNYSGSTAANTNYLRLNMDGATVKFSGNPYMVENSFPEDRLAINTNTLIESVCYNLIRPAGGTGFAISKLDSDGNVTDVLYSTVAAAGEVLGAWYHTNQDAWQNTASKLYGINKTLSEYSSLTEGDRVRVGFYAIPEYNIMQHSGSMTAANAGTLTADLFETILTSNELGKGAFVGYDFTIDNTPPTIEGTPTLNGNTLSITASDNHAIAYIAVLSLDGETVYAEAAPGTDNYTITLDASSAIANAPGYVAAYVGDYAGNEKAVAVQVNNNAHVEKTVYVLTDTLEANRDYLIVNTNVANTTGYGLTYTTPTNTGTTNTSAVRYAVSINTGNSDTNNQPYIDSSDAPANGIWTTATYNTSYYTFANVSGSRTWYVGRSSNNGLTINTSPSDRAWSYSNHYLKSGTSTRYLYYSGSNFTIGRTQTAVYLYVKTEINYDIDPYAVESVTVTPNTLDLYKGNTAQLIAKVLPLTVPDRSVTWSSTNNSVATVDQNGKVTAVSAGTATIRATANADGSKYGECVVNVTSINKELSAAIWDAEGDVYFSYFNANNLPNWTKRHNTPTTEYITSALMADTSSLYACTNDLSVSNIYTVNRTSYALTKEGENYVAAFGMAPVGSSFGSDYFVYAFAKYIIFGNLTEETDADLGTYCGFPYGLVDLSETDVGDAYAVAICIRNRSTTSAGYYFLDETGKIWQINQTYSQNSGISFGSPTLVYDTGVTAGLQYNSIYYDGTNLYWTHVDGEYAQLYILANANVAASRKFYSAGNFGENVWPAAGMYTNGSVAPASVGDEYEVMGGEDLGELELQIQATREELMTEDIMARFAAEAERMNAKMFEMAEEEPEAVDEEPIEEPEEPIEEPEEPVEEPEEPGDEEPIEEPEEPADEESIEEPEEPVEEPEEPEDGEHRAHLLNAAAGVNTSGTVAFSESAAATNGLFEVSYDTTELTCTGTAKGTASNLFVSVHLDASTGKIKVAYAMKGENALAANTTIATADFTALKCDEKTMTVATKERGETYNLTESDTVAVDGLGHNWGTPTWSWTGNDADGYTAATATFVCTRDSSHTETVTATVTSAENNACQIVYTATATFEGQTYTETKTVAITAYYLIGSMTNWQVDPAYRFTPNGSTEGEFILNTTLAVGDQIKVVQATGTTTGTWYPADYGNYYVDYAHSGSVNVYFRPASNGDWWSFHSGGFFYISKLHTVTVVTDGNGTASINPMSPDLSATVYVTATPNDGYHYDHTELYKKTGAGENDLEPITLDWNETNKTFTMPDCDVVIKVYFAAHTWGEPTYVWAADNSTVTATRECDGCDATETETVSTTYAVTTDPTCEGLGVGTYTATFTNSAFTTQTKTVDIDPIGHDWDTPTYVWDENYNCTATRVCKNDSTHTEVEMAPGIGQTTTPATCETDGVMTYTATFANEAFAEQTTTAVIPATGHDWQFVDFTWTGDDENGYTAAVANYVCTHDGTHTKTETATVTSVTTPATCETAGSTVYTATQGEYTDTKTVTIPATGHEWTFVDFTWTGNDTDGYTAAVANYVCAHDSTHTKTETATVTSTTTAATCEAAGSTVYTATEGEHTDTKTVTIPALGHDWQFVDFTWTGDDTNGYTAAVANYVCTHDGTHTKTETATVTSTTTAATCEAAGQTVYTATENGHTDTKTVTIPALGHDWQFVDFTWTETETGWTAVANYKCNNDNTHTKTENATVTSVTTDATCEAAGQIVYTATENGHTDTKTVTIPALGHDWQFVDFTWTGDETNGYTAAVANYVCAHDGTHTKTETATVTSATTPATCEAAGSIVYTATEGEHTDTKTVTIPATGHNWGTPTYTWAADNSTVTATRVCANDPTHVETETVNTSYEVTTAPTFTTVGEGVYTATFTNPAFTEQTKTVEIPKLTESATVAYVDFRHGKTLQVFVVEIKDGEDTQTPAFTAFDQIGTYTDCRYDEDDMWTTTVASTVTTDTVYVLKWINVYTVTFLDAEGAVAKTVSVDENGTIPASEIPTPMKEGYTLTGWEEANLTFDVTQPITRNVTLTPVYTINTYTVTFVNNGETYLEVTVQHGATMAAPEQPQNGNKVFDGWFADGAEEAFDFDTPITGDLTLTAHWSEEVVKTGTRIVFADGAVLYNNTTPYVIWNGTAEPAFKVEGEDGADLTGSDYTFEYLRNSEPGTGYIRVTVTNANYDSPADRWFKIYLPASASLTVENIKAGIQLTWEPVEGAAGYVIYRRAWSTTTNGWTSFDRWNNVTETTWIDGSDASHKVYAGTRYQYGVKAYFAVKTDDVSGQEIGGAMDNYNLGVVSPLKTTVRITTRTLTSVTSADGKLTVKWSGSKVFTGYKVEIATDANFTNLVKEDTIASPTTYSKVYEGLTVGTTYYVRIRSYHVFNGMTYHGEWSNVKSAALN